MEYSIYGLYTLGDTQFRYVGVTQDLDARKQVHIASTDNSLKSVWTKSLKAFGLPLLSKTLCKTDKINRFKVEMQFISAAAERGHPLLNAPQWKAAHADIPQYVKSSWEGWHEIYFSLGGPFGNDIRASTAIHCIQEIEHEFPSLFILSGDNIERSKWKRSRLQLKLQSALAEVKHIESRLAACAS